MQFISDLSDEHIDFLEPTDRLFPSAQVLTKPIYDEIQDFHSKTLLYTIPMLLACDKALKRFEDLVDIVDRCGYDGAPLHLKIKAYHADVANGVREKSSLKQSDIKELLMPRDWYLKSIDPDGKRPFVEVKLQIVKRAHQYFDSGSPQEVQQAQGHRRPSQSTYHQGDCQGEEEGYVQDRLRR